MHHLKLTEEEGGEAAVVEEAEELHLRVVGWCLLLPDLSAQLLKPETAGRRSPEGSRAGCRHPEARW